MLSDWKQDYGARAAAKVVIFIAPGHPLVVSGDDRPETTKKRALEDIS